MYLEIKSGFINLFFSKSISLAVFSRQLAVGSWQLSVAVFSRQSALTLPYFLITLISLFPIFPLFPYLPSLPHSKCSIHKIVEGFHFLEYIQAEFTKFRCGNTGIFKTMKECEVFEFQQFDIREILWKTNWWSL